MITTVQKPEVRKAAYGVVAAVMTLLMGLGIGKADAAAQYLESAPSGRDILRRFLSGGCWVGRSPRGR